MFGSRSRALVAVQAALARRLDLLLRLALLLHMAAVLALLAWLALVMLAGVLAALAFTVSLALNIIATCVVGTRVGRMVPPVFSAVLVVDAVGVPHAHVARRWRGGHVNILWVIRSGVARGLRGGARASEQGE